jgi:predicted RecB family nuclease
LSRITLKQVNNLEKKGILTVKQLSFIYKPRRKNKKVKKVSFSYKPELHALSIRTQKVYIQAIPSIERMQKEIFLDIEGLPDDDFYYLFGILVVDDNTQEYISFWIDNINEEKDMWDKVIFW